MKTTQDICRVLFVGFIGVLKLVLGNLISIGPGLYESNHTLDGSSRAVYVLNSCEFMHNGRLQSVHFYAGSPDWLAIQIWRPAGTNTNTGRMKLVYQKYMEVTTHHDIYQVQFEVNEVHVKSGDVVGFTKLNDSFPISYVFHPLQSVDIWYHNIDSSQDYPQIDDVIDFEEMGFPYRFSVTVRFWADIISPDGVNSNENVLLESNKDLDKADYKDWSVGDKHKTGEDLQYMYNVTEKDQGEIKFDNKAEKLISLNNANKSQVFNSTDANSNNNTVNTTLDHKLEEIKKDYKINSSMVSSSSSTINPLDMHTETMTDKFMASASQPNIGNFSSSPESILNKGEGEYSVSSMDSKIGSTIKPLTDKNSKNQGLFHNSVQHPSPRTDLNVNNANSTEKP